MERWLELEIEGSDVTWCVSRARYREAVHAPFRLEVTASAKGAEARVPDLVGRAASARWTLDDEGERETSGLVEAVTAEGAAYRIAIAPRIAFLEDTVDHQVFVDKDALEIVRAVLGEHGVGVEGAPTRTLAKRAQCVQAFESDLAFVSRLLAEEGIAWVCAGKEAIAIVDDASTLRDGVTLPFREEAGFQVGEAVHRVALRRGKALGAVVLGEYDFTNPQLDLTVRAREGDAASERFEFPAGYRDAVTGGALARARLEEANARRTVLHGEASSRRLVAGEVLTIAGAPRRDVNARWLLLRVEHEWQDLGADGPLHVARFDAVSAASTYRPPRARAPRLGGVQSATITGASGMEIHAESFGRIHAQHRWDRRAPASDKASAWLRVVQPALSGASLLPRVGWEALVGYRGPSGDEPYVLGRLTNGVSPPPATLPASKTQSAFGSLTTPSGGAANLVATDDSAGAEAMTFVASKDLRERTENDKRTTVIATDTHHVSGHRKIIVGQVHAVSVAGAQTHAVAASRTVNVDANQGISAASEAITIGGGRRVTASGDYGTSCASLARVVSGAKVETAIEHQAREVQGASLVVVSGTWKSVAGAHASVSVSGASLEAVAGGKSVTTAKYALAVKGALKETLASRSVSAASDCVEDFGGAAHYKIAGSAKLAAANVVVKAKGKLTLKAGGVTIEMTPGEVTVTGEFQGSVAAVDSGDQKYG